MHRTIFTLRIIIAEHILLILTNVRTKVHYILTMTNINNILLIITYSTLIHRAF